MRIKDASTEELVYLSLWDKWTDEVMELAAKGQRLPVRNDELLIAYFEHIGEEPPRKGSPICMMFQAFIAGINTLLTEMRLNEEGKEETK